MKRVLSVLFALSMLTIVVPTNQAAETVTEEYSGATGYFIGPLPNHGISGVPSGRGLGMSWRPCPGGCDVNDDGTEDIPDVIKLSGGPLIATQAYSNVIVSISDDVYGNAAALSACFFHPDGDNVCQMGEDTLDGVEDYQAGLACGPRPLIGAPFASDRATTFVYTFAVLEDLTFCGGSTGTLTGDFF